MRKISLKTRSGKYTKSKTDRVISVPVEGFQKKTKTDQDHIVTIDMSKATDLGTPGNLLGALGEFTGKIQQSCNGSLMNITYELHV